MSQVFLRRSVSVLGAVSPDVTGRVRLRKAHTQPASQPARAHSASQTCSVLLLSAPPPPRRPCWPWSRKEELRSEDLGTRLPRASPGPEGTGTWSVRKSLSISRRLPPLVAMGTVIFIITPWMGNKPKFWICGQRGQESVRPAGAGRRGWRTKSQGRSHPPPARLGSRPLQGPWHICCRSSEALPNHGGGCAHKVQGAGSWRLGTSRGALRLESKVTSIPSLSQLGDFIAWCWRPPWAAVGAGMARAMHLLLERGERIIK